MDSTPSPAQAVAEIRAALARLESARTVGRPVRLTREWTAAYDGVQQALGDAATSARVLAEATRNPASTPTIASTDAINASYAAHGAALDQINTLVSSFVEPDALRSVFGHQHAAIASIHELLAAIVREHLPAERDRLLKRLLAEARALQIRERGPGSLPLRARYDMAEVDAIYKTVHAAWTLLLASRAPIPPDLLTLADLR